MTKEIKKLGRPVNVNSNRQIELKKKAELRELGLVKRGRPVVEGSKNQLDKQRKQELREMGLLNGKKGRPVNMESKRQQRIQDLEFRRANGTLKLGRPKTKKVEEKEA